MTNIKKGAVIFDFDGVLADSEHVAMQIIQRVAKNKKVPPPSKEFIRSHEAHAIMKSLNVAWWELPYFAYVARKWAVELNPRATLFPWSKDLIATANHIFGEAWIVSSNSPERIFKCLAAANINFEKQRIHGNIGFFGKAGYLRKLIQKENLDTSRVVYVGDETRDIAAAHKAGIRCLSVGWGLQNAELLNSLNPGLVLEDPTQFESWVKKILLAPPL